MCAGSVTDMLKMRRRQVWHIRCEQASFAEREIGTSSDPQVRQETIFSGMGADGRRKLDRMEPFLAFSVPVVLRAVLTSVLALAEAALRWREDSGESVMLMVLVLRADRRVSGVAAHSMLSEFRRLMGSVCLRGGARRSSPTFSALLVVVRRVLDR